MKKGFTLIELLAVIVILAIIALIAVPIILDIINSSKEESTLQSGNLYLSAVKNAIAKENLNGEFSPRGCNIKSDGNIICDGKELKVEMDGTRPSSGYIEIEEGLVSYVEDLELNSYELETNEDLNLVIVKPEENDESDECVVDYDTTLPNKPELMGVLTPVKYDGKNWVVTTSYDSEWYNYRKQEWANAVILKENVSKQVGDIIKVPTDSTDTASDVQAMLVWIPRYEYRIEDGYGKCGESKTLPGAIDIRFVSKEKIETDEGYIMHPAFTFGSDELSGIWVGKFETSHTIYSSTTTSNQLNCSNETCETADNLRILPNVQSLRYNNVSNFFYVTRSMSRNENIFGINSSKTDTHMMKNVEWGAVAYLSQSKYGKYGNGIYTGAVGLEKEVYVNNCNSFITGIAGDTVSASSSADTCTKEENKYNKDQGMKASTTGNITGIYDISGGAWEYVMGNFNDTPGASGFESSDGDSKYYDKYTDNDPNIELYTGHALGETQGWYGDWANFTSASFPWFDRGGCDETAGVGVFATHYGHGGAYWDVSFRIVFAPIIKGE